ncbi:MAG: Ig-like domain-containing protein [Candidatus Kapabacteria bacterium]|nr:Ig-like domain-containing protein [Candidatus Kapabacteria bacterium]
MNFLKKQINKLSALLIILIASCANNQAPSGGLPNKIPPKVLENYPLNKTLNYKNDKVVFYFSKYINRTSINDNIFISPKIKNRLSWSGKELTVNFLQPFDSNTTYCVVLGTDYTDYYGKNKPEKSFSLIFSTGNNLDSGFMRGKLNDNDPSGVYIFAYYLDNINPDTLDIRKLPPKYRTQVGSSGHFEINALKFGKYRVFAVRDQFKDEIYDEGIDGIGLAHKDIEVKNDSLAFVELKIGLPIDKVKPSLFEVEANYSRKIEAVFNKSIDSLTVNAGSFILKDSLTNKEHEITDAFISSLSGRKVTILLKDDLDSAKKYILKAKNDSEKMITDSIGNPINDTLRTRIFKGTADKDTLVPKFSFVPFRDSVMGINPHLNFRFRFNTPMQSFNISDKVKIYNVSKKDSADYSSKEINPLIISINPVRNLENDSWYELRFNAEGLKSYSGIKMKDTIVKLRFKTSDLRETGVLSGFFDDSTSYKPPYIIKITNKEKRISYTCKVNNEKKWKFEELEPGTYTIEVFQDSNNNGKYDFGTPFPVQFSERFRAIEKEYSVRARWTAEDAYIYMK